NGGNCVEVATNLSGVVPVRDSKDRRGPVLLFPPRAVGSDDAGPFASIR
ncbi:DUF397 domain-containing protein, partial [Micromonospora sp. NPDC005298]